jgi:hypothetical protein
VTLIIGQQLCRNFKSDISLLEAAIASLQIFRQAFGQAFSD